MKIEIEAVIQKRRERHEEAHQKRLKDARERLERMSQRSEESIQEEEERFREYATTLSNKWSKYQPNLLHSWFQFDNWSVHEGLLILCDLDPDSVPLGDDDAPNVELWRSHEILDLAPLERFRIERIQFLDGIRPLSGQTIEIIGESAANGLLSRRRFLYEKAVRLWKSGVHSETRYAPKYFIDWAIGKGIEISWFNWAKANNYYGADTSESRSLSTTERNTLLVLIAALSKQCGIAHEDRASASTISRLVDSLGASVSAETIRKHLDMIPDALARRSR